MGKRIYSDPWVWYFFALLIMLIPAKWILAAVCAAVFHELCHIGTIMALEGRIHQIHITVGGIVMHTEIPGRGREILAALAGPAGSFLLLFLCHMFPELAICGCVQGLYNLIPIYPLDGGRILYLLADCLFPQKSDIIILWTERTVLSGILLLALGASTAFSLGFSPILLASILTIKAICRKRPCKWRRIGVQ